MSTILFLITLAIGSGTILLVAWMFFIARSRHAQSQVEGGEALRKLSAIQTELGDLGARLGAVEKMLRDVG